MKKKMQALKFAVMCALVIAYVLFISASNSTNELPANAIELGENLFFDPILSLDQSVSCSSCHKPQFAFADNRKLSLGVGSKPTPRNAPSVMYLNLTDVIFWDGRAQTIEHQAFFPITHPDEMGMTPDETVKRLTESEYYKAAFKKLYNESPTVANISIALGAFQRSLAFYDAPYDRWYKGDDQAISGSALNGLILFTGKAKCSFCHRIGNGWHDREFGTRNIGLYNGKEYNDQGRFAITHDSVDLGAFKTPHLRNIAVTGPYMHDGSLKTLREVLEFYNKRENFVRGALNVDEEMADSLALNDQEMKDLEALLLTFTDDNLEKKLDRYIRQQGNR